jgi:hypothetical protein
MISKPKARLTAQARNIVLKPLIWATGPIIVGPKAKPTLKKQVGIAMATPLPPAEEKSAAITRLAGMAMPMPMPKTTPMMMN